MKGIAHFMTGLAVASCVPEAVRAAAEGHPLYFVAGAVFGLLPDTLDFRFARFWHRHTLEAMPDPRAPDPAVIADAAAWAVEHAATTGRPVVLRLNTVRLAANAWQAYTVAFDRPRRRVTATCTGPVNTGGAPLPSGSTLGVREAVATRALAARVVAEGDDTVRVDAFDGPTLRFMPHADGEVGMEFLPWHRAWSHSLVLAAAGGTAAALLAGSWAAGLVVAGAWAAHVGVDQLGHMGANLWFPFTRRRTLGARRHHASDPWPNLVAVWLSALLILWNLARLTPNGTVHLPLLGLVTWAGAAPLLGAWTLDRWLCRRWLTA